MFFLFQVPILPGGRRCCLCQVQVSHFPEGASKCQASPGCRQGSGVRGQVGGTLHYSLWAACAGSLWCPSSLWSPVHSLLPASCPCVHQLSLSVLGHLWAHGRYSAVPHFLTLGTSASGSYQYVGSLTLLCCSMTCGTCDPIMAYLSSYLPQWTGLLSQHTGMGWPWLVT